MTMKGKSMRKLLAATSVILSAGSIGFAADTPGTCTTPPASVQSFSAERVLPLTGIQSTRTPQIPPALAASLASGVQELRQVMTYNPRLNTLTVTYFTAAAKSPVPTPVNLIYMSTITTYTVPISQVYTSCVPYPSVLFVGKVEGSPAGVFGDPNGALVAVGIGYTAGETPKIESISEVVAGVASVWSAAPDGTLTFPASSGSPGNGEGGIEIVLKPAAPANGRLQIVQNGVTFDASGSTGTGLTYAWTADKSVRFLPDASAASPTVMFNSGTGDYNLTLTVTDSSGATATKTVPVTFFGRL
jgi:hypothetical protein